jgi:hypothetical protein
MDPRNPAGMTLPPDADALFAEAARRYPDLIDWKWGGDNISGKKPGPETQRTQVMIRTLRKDLARFDADTKSDQAAMGRKS